MINPESRMENPNFATKRLQFRILSSWLPPFGESHSPPSSRGTFSIRIINPQGSTGEFPPPPIPAEAHLDVVMADDGSAAAHGAAILQVRGFFQKNRAAARTFFVTCPMGISRSTALALGLMYLESRDEREALEHLFSIQPQALPNLEVLTAWDGVLGSRLTREYLWRYSRRPPIPEARWKNSTGSGRLPGCPTPHPASAATPT